MITFEFLERLSNGQHICTLFIQAFQIQQWPSYWSFFGFLKLLFISLQMSGEHFRKIIQNSALLLKNYTMNLPIENQPHLKPLIQSLASLKVEILGLQKAENMKTGIGVRNIFEKGKLRVTLYYLPPGQVMQLHNHPSMLVVTYILKGALQAQIYSPNTENMIFEKETVHLSSGNISFIDGFRTNQKNLHELKSIQGTYFIDILFPDYGQGRQCSFFEEEKPLLDNRWKLKQVYPKEIDFFQI